MLLFSWSSFFRNICGWFQNGFCSFPIHMRSIPCGFISDFSVVNNSVEKKHTALIRITLVYELLLSVLQHPMFGIFLRWFILL